jgi:MFS family permease
VRSSHRFVVRDAGRNASPRLSGCLGAISVVLSWFLQEQTPRDFEEMQETASQAESQHANVAQGLTDQQQTRGMRYTYIAVCFGSIMFVLMRGSAIGPLFIKRLGGSDLQALLIAAFVTLFHVIQIPIALKIAPSKGKTFMLGCWYVYALLLAVAVLLPSFLPPGQTTVISVLILVAMAFAIRSAGGPFWFPLIHDVVPVDRRGRFFGKLRALWTSGCFVYVLLAGVFLGSQPEPDIWKFQVILGIAAIFALIRNVFVSVIPTGNSLSRDLDYDDWKAYIKEFLLHRELLLFCTYFGAFSILATFLRQPLILYLRHMGLPDGNNVIVFNFNMLGMVLFLLAGGVLVDRFGTKPIFLVSHVILFLLCMAVVGIGMLPLDPARILMAVAMILSGGTLAVAGIACTAQMFHLVPDRGRVFFMSLAMIILWSGFTISPLVAGDILNRTGPDWTLHFLGVQLDIFQVMFASAGLAMLPIIGLLRFVDNVKPKAQSPSAT